MSNEVAVQKGVSAVSIIESVSINQCTSLLEKISSFQNMVKTQLSQNHDYGVIPGTGTKPTLLKPGAEKILMLMGVTSGFEIASSTRDFEKGFFQYQIKCRLLKDGVVITEGLGAANTREKKYVKNDPYTMDNTVLKVAKKRALIDATLLIASLSQIFTQDVEDMDLTGAKPTSGQVTHDSADVISTGQAKRMYALSNANAEICKNVCKKYGYDRSADVKKIDYENICKEIEAAAREQDTWESQ